MGRETIKRAIHSAFTEIPIPASIVDTAIGDTETRETFRSALQSKRWTEIPTEVLCFHHDALFFLSPDGVRYLLPAFMIAALESPASPLSGTLVSVLSRPEGLDDDRLFLETMSPLTDPQREAVRAFLEYLRDEGAEDWPDDAPNDALRKYWTS